MKYKTFGEFLPFILLHADECMDEHVYFTIRGPLKNICTLATARVMTSRSYSDDLKRSKLEIVEIREFDVLGENSYNVILKVLN